MCPVFQLRCLSASAPGNGGRRASRSRRQDRKLTVRGQPVDRDGAYAPRDARSAVRAPHSSMVTGHSAGSRRASASTGSILTLRLSIVEMRRVEDRLLLLLSLLADRWGRVQADGVCLPLRLTHDVLGRMVCAHRSSVTTALNRLLQKGALSRGVDGSLVLRGAVGAECRLRGGAAPTDSAGALWSTGATRT